MHHMFSIMQCVHLHCNICRYFCIFSAKYIDFGAVWRMDHESVNSFRSQSLKTGIRKQTNMESNEICHMQDTVSLLTITHFKMKEVIS